ncbi:MAG: hypothetical protein HRU39_06475 [Salinicola sp.]|uniref:hypothetical protein n=1 Tax=Salinicola sp. TaxID=1978524 RepID=UPI001D1BCACD|nr:hypothetical protein [Salinicola sp.]NRB55614.1 hypothetical protein [Salinicola sp.]
MRLLLHPGHAKCGSTSIQRAIIRNRPGLADNQVVVPDPRLRLPGEAGFDPRGETPREFFRQIMENGGDTTSLRARLESWRESPLWRDATFVISAENLINHLMGPIGEGIHRVLADYFDDVEVIYYIRRQDDYLLSAWQQWGFKEGKTFAEYSQEALRRANPHYLAVGQAFGRLYGSASVTVRPLQAEALRGGELLTDFFAHLVEDPSRLSFDRDRSNLSLNPFFCEILAGYQGLFRDIHDDRLKQRLARTLGVGHELFQRERDFMDPEMARRIMAHHREENLHLQQQFFPHVPFETVFGDREEEGLDPGERVQMSRQRAEQLQKHVIRELLELLQSMPESAKSPA